MFDDFLLKVFSGSGDSHLCCYFNHWILGKQVCPNQHHIFSCDQFHLANNHLPPSCRGLIGMSPHLQAALGQSLSSSQSCHLAAI